MAGWKRLIPRIQDIKDEAVNDLNLRIAKILKKTPMEEDEQAESGPCSGYGSRKSSK